MQGSRFVRGRAAEARRSMASIAMDDICLLPVCFVGVTENALKAHLRYLRFQFKARRSNGILALRRRCRNSHGEGGMTPVNGVNVLRSVAEILDLSWPCQMAIGYALGSEDHHLPGEIVYRDPLRNAGYQLGKSVGKLLRKTISQFVNKPTSCRLLLASDNAQLPIMNDVNLEMRFKASALDQFCKELEGVGKRARTLATLQRFTV